MRRIVAFSVFISMVTALLVASPSSADPGGRGQGGLDAYTAQVTPSQLGELARLGHDVAEQKSGAGGRTGGRGGEGRHNVTKSSPPATIPGRGGFSR